MKNHEQTTPIDGSNETANQPTDREVIWQAALALLKRSRANGKPARAKGWQVLSEPEDTETPERISFTNQKSDWRQDTDADIVHDTYWEKGDIRTLTMTGPEDPITLDLCYYDNDNFYNEGWRHIYARDEVDEEGRPLDGFGRDCLKLVSKIAKWARKNYPETQEAESQEA